MNPIDLQLALAIAKLPNEGLRVQMAAALAGSGYDRPAYTNWSSFMDAKVAIVRRAFDLAYRDDLVAMRGREENA